MQEITQQHVSAVSKIVNIIKRVTENNTAHNTVDAESHVLIKRT